MDEGRDREGGEGGWGMKGGVGESNPPNCSRKNLAQARSSTTSHDNNPLTQRVNGD